MALNFPDNPQVGDVFRSGERSWHWTGATWAVYNEAQVIGGLSGVEFVSTPDFIDVDTTTTPSSVEGRISWNQADGTFNAGLSGGAVLQLGQETLFPPVKNNSGVLIPNGSVVMATGSQGDRVTVAKAVTDGTYDAQYLIGVATADIPVDSETGKVVIFGYVRDLNTSAWAPGTNLYPNPLVPGGWTATQPTAPAFRSPIAMVVRQHANTGRIIVRMTNGSSLGETDDNVHFISLASGDLLQYDGAIWENVASIAPEKVTGTAVVSGDARLLPSQSGQSGKYLTTDGTTASWAEGGGGGAGGAVICTVVTIAEDAVTATVRLPDLTVVSALNISGHTLGVGSTVGVVSAIDDASWSWYIVSRYQAKGVPWTVAAGDRYAGFPVSGWDPTGALGFKSPAIVMPESPNNGGEGIMGSGYYLNLVYKTRGELSLNNWNTQASGTAIHSRSQVAHGFLFVDPSTETPVTDLTNSILYYDHRTNLWGNIGKPPSLVSESPSTHLLGVASNGNLYLMRLIRTETTNNTLAVSWFNLSGTDPFVGTWTDWSRVAVTTTTTSLTNTGIGGVAYPNGSYSFVVNATTNSYIGGTYWGKVEASTFSVGTGPTRNSISQVVLTPRFDGSTIFARRSVTGTGVIRIIQRDTLGYESFWDTNVAAKGAGDVVAVEGMHWAAHPDDVNAITDVSAAFGLWGSVMDSEGYAWFPTWYYSGGHWYLRVYRTGQTNNITLVDEIDYGTGALSSSAVKRLAMCNYKFTGGPLATNKIGMWIPNTNTDTGTQYEPSAYTLFKYAVYDF